MLKIWACLVFISAMLLIIALQDKDMRMFLKTTAAVALIVLLFNPILGWWLLLGGSVFLLFISKSHLGEQK